MADQKISELTALALPTSKDLLLIIDDPTGTPVSKSVTYKVLFGTISANVVFQERFTAQSNTLYTGALANVAANLHLSGDLVLDNANTVASNTTTGVKGTIQWDDSYMYVCYATDKWKRVAIADF